MAQPYRCGDGAAVVTKGGFFASHGKWLKPAAFAAALTALYAMSRHMGLTECFADSGYIDGFRAYAAEHYLSAALIYVAATTAGCVLLALPGVCFAIVSGVLFGPVMGTLLCLVSATFGAVLSFLAGRFFLKDSVKPMLEKSPALKRFLFDNADGSALVLLMVTRLLPVFPYNLQNFAYGITDVGLLPYTIYTFVFMFPGVALFTVGAAGLSDAENRAGLMCAAAVFAVMLALIGVFLYKRYLKRGRAA